MISRISVILLVALTACMPDPSRSRGAIKRSVDQLTRTDVIEMDWMYLGHDQATDTGVNMHLTWDSGSPDDSLLIFRIGAPSCPAAASGPLRARVDDALLDLGDVEYHQGDVLAFGHGVIVCLGYLHGRLGRANIERLSSASSVLVRIGGRDVTLLPNHRESLAAFLAALPAPQGKSSTEGTTGQASAP